MKEDYGGGEGIWEKRTGVESIHLSSAAASASALAASLGNSHDNP